MENCFKTTNNEKGYSPMLIIDVKEKVLPATKMFIKNGCWLKLSSYAVVV